MSHLFSLMLGLLLLAPQNQDLPDAFHKLPEETKSQATVIVSGTFGRSIGPCIFMPDGTRRRPLHSWIRIKKVYRGEVGAKQVYINLSLPPIDEKTGMKFEVGREYLMLLRPDEESMKAMKTGDYMPLRNAVTNDEILAVVVLK